MNYKFILFFILFLSLNLFKGFGQTLNQYIKAGDNAFKIGKYYEAISYFEKATLFQKKSDKINYKIGQSYLELKDYTNSLKAFSRIQSKSNFDYLFYKMGDGFMLLGKYEQAIKNFEFFKNVHKEKGFYYNDAIQKISSCYWALDHSKSKNELIIKSLDKVVNSQFSEFSASYFKDSLLQVTSFFQDENNKKADYVSDILFFKKNKKKYQKVEVKIPFNEKLEPANGFYLSEKNRFYFNQCENTNIGYKRCDIYVTEYKGSKWSKPVFLNINDKKFTSTQASVHVNDAGKDVLYFVSNRNDGLGKNDIWTAIETEYGVFENLQVLPKNINTINDEGSPFYDKKTKTLYFSSKWHYGYGGYDIFKSKVENDKYLKPENLGLPFNSSANDLFYNLSSKDKGFFSSNREGAMKLRGISCCYDIFSFEENLVQKRILKDSISRIDSLIAVIKIDSVNLLLSKIREMLPITVYFHNDEPNPKTIDSLTKFSYTETYNEYLLLKSEYYEMNDFDEIDAFFYDLSKGYTNLKAFEKLLALMIPNNSIKLEIKGYCSPLAKDKYNVLLSKRRISSIENELKSNKILNKAISEERLIIEELPFGEEKAKDGVSDDYFNVKESIYNPNAARERKVILVGVLLK